MSVKPALCYAKIVLYGVKLALCYAKLALCYAKLALLYQFKSPLQIKPLCGLPQFWGQISLMLIRLFLSKSKIGMDFSKENHSIIFKKRGLGISPKVIKSKSENKKYHFFIFPFLLFLAR